MEEETGCDNSRGLKERTMYWELQVFSVSGEQEAYAWLQMMKHHLHITDLQIWFVNNRGWLKCLKQGIDIIMFVFSMVGKCRAIRGIKSGGGKFR